MNIQKESAITAAVFVVVVGVGLSCTTAAVMVKKKERPNNYLHLTSTLTGWVYFEPHGQSMVAWSTACLPACTYLAQRQEEENYKYWDLIKSITINLSPSLIYPTPRPHWKACLLLQNDLNWTLLNPLSTSTARPLTFMELSVGWLVVHSRWMRMYVAP